MAGPKMWVRRLMVTLMVLGVGCAASGVAYRAAGAATSLGSLALAR